MAHVYSNTVAILYGASVNYSVIIVKINCKNPQYHKKSAYHGAS